MTDTVRTLRSGFLDSVQRFPKRIALEVDGKKWTYEALYELAGQIAATMQQRQPQTKVRLTAVLGERSVTAYAGILGTLLRGHGYVPLNPGFPLTRTIKMLQRSEAETLIVDESSAEQLTEILPAIDRPLLVLLPDSSDVTGWQTAFPQHQFVAQQEHVDGRNLTQSDVDRNDIAYLLFTSGSTGDPKGVMVAHRNIVTFLDTMIDRYDVTEEDRLTQIFELVFDLSLFDLFVAWNTGACVCVPNKSDLLMADFFLESAQPTIWFSVPSTALLMNRLGKLTPDAFPSLRVSLFCGEALTAEVASAWSQAASSSLVENLYGPTELTLACTLYRWQGESSSSECENGIVPIGWPYPEMDVLVADEELREVAPGECGELLMAGPQVALGYWQDDERTARAFVTPPGKDQIYYRTGDRVRRPEGDDPLLYLGRLDHQLQVNGYRVELGEVESALRDVTGVDAAIVVGWPLGEGRADRLYGFVQTTDVDNPIVIRELRDRLPHYMVPREIRAVAEFPLNSNGKIDRRVLAEMLQESLIAN